jgi:PKD domain/Leucine Rich repeats (2 copies)
MGNRNKNIYGTFVAIAFVIISIVSCHSTTAPASKPPAANAGPDQNAKVGQYVILDGSASKRGDGDTLSYKWTAAIGNPTVVRFLDWYPQITVGFTVKGVYRFYLVVNNGSDESQPDEVVATVKSREQVVFADPVLELQFRYARKDPNGPLTYQQLSTLDTLVAYVGLGPVTSLKGIEFCSNLECLNMGLNQITDLTPIANLRKLLELDLDQNYSIIDVSSLAGLVQLVKLNLESNNISDVSALKGLTRLTSLRLLDNPVKDISPLKDLQNLTDLWIGHYGPSAAKVTGASVISAFTKLDILWMTNCGIENISFVSTLSCLHLLQLGNNDVTDITPLASCAELERLQLDLNHITDISSLEKLYNLNLVDLRFNSIADISALVKNTGLGPGDAVFLTGNPLDSISVNEYIPELRNRGVFVSY